jgi:hypothetical protein
MDFSDKELKVLLQALYRFRGEVSGASQSEQNKFGLVVSVIDKIETKVGPLTAERTRFDREMDESLAILKTGKMRAAKGGADLDKAGGAPKVKSGAGAPRAGRGASEKDRPAKARAAKASAAEVTKSKKASGPSKKAGAAKSRS